MNIFCVKHKETNKIFCMCPFCEDIDYNNIKLGEYTTHPILCCNKCGAKSIFCPTTIILVVSSSEKNDIRIDPQIKKLISVRKYSPFYDYIDSIGFRPDDYEEIILKLSKTILITNNLLANYIPRKQYESQALTFMARFMDDKEVKNFVKSGYDKKIMVDLDLELNEFDLDKNDFRKYFEQRRLSLGVYNYNLSVPLKSNYGGREYNYVKPYEYPPNFMAASKIYLYCSDCNGDKFKVCLTSED